MSTLVVQNLRCSLKAVSTLTQHFHIVNSYFPESFDSEDVYSDLSLIVNFKTQGVKLLAWSLIEEDLDQSNSMSQHLRTSGRGMKHNDSKEETKSTRSLLPLPGMEEVQSLVLQHGIVEDNFMQLPPVKMNNMFVSEDTSLTVLQGYYWPVLRYLELEVTTFNFGDLLLLNNSFPQLTYLKLYIPFRNIPEAVWTFDWETLPWKTGFVAVYIEPSRSCDEYVELNLQAKITVRKMPPIHFYDANERNLHVFCSRYVRMQLAEDFSMNELTLPGYYQFTFHDSFNISLNFSHNVLTSADIFRRFHVSKKANYPHIRKLDLSFNKLNNSGKYSSDFLLIRSLNELYLHHNEYQDFPKYPAEIEDRQYQYFIKDLTELHVFDMSYNSLENPNVNFDEITYDDFSSLREINFGNNFLVEIPAVTYRSIFLKYANFSNNKITFSTV